jgi:acetoin utilization deacetylase AcuC-like enzyme
MAPKSACPATTAPHSQRRAFSLACFSPLTPATPSDSHPECPARHSCVVKAFESSGLAARCVALTPRPASDSEILRVHSQEHLDSLYALYDPAGESIQTKGDLFWNKHTAEAARLSAGCAVTATLAVARGKLDAAFAVIRPPGHHAECARAMGFCFLNNASIAALAALEEPGIKRVLILDWDVHHGNGIEAIHYADPRILYVSLHRYSTHPASWFYPGTGAATDCGEGPGKGFTLNVPWPERGGGDADYLAAFELVIQPIAASFNPSLVIISAGFDAAEGDPLGQMLVSPAGYHAMATRCAAMAQSKRCVALLEGGYNLSATATSAVAALRGLLGEAPPAMSARCRPRLSTEAALRAVLAAQAPHWPCVAAREHGAAVDAHFAALHMGAAQLGTPKKAPPATPTPKKAAKPATPAASAKTATEASTEEGAPA